MYHIVKGTFWLFLFVRKLTMLQIAEKGTKILLFKASISLGCDNFATSWRQMSVI